MTTSSNHPASCDIADLACAAPLASLRAALPGALQTLSPDQHVALEGSTRGKVIGVISGTLRCFRMTPDGRRHITRFVGAGGLIGLGRIDAFRMSSEAVSISTIVTFNARALDGAIAARADVRDAVFEALTRELVARDRIQFRLGRLWADERVADFLLERADDGQGLRDEPIYLEMSRADMADHLGVTIETVSRALSRFQREGAILMKDAHHVQVVHAGALGALADGDGDAALRYARRSGTAL